MAKKLSAQTSLLPPNDDFIWFLPMEYADAWCWLQQHGYRTTPENIALLQTANLRRPVVNIDKILAAIAKRTTAQEQALFIADLQEKLQALREHPLSLPDGLEVATT